MTTTDDAPVVEIADELLTQSYDGVGVEVWCDQQRLYARGVVPPRQSQ
ncbi:MAG TPA: hypothetical protein VHS81_05665 [Caulobacteraceae bacterium]|nr:hypothetical protein [Caulobacteraceae bacterium]